MSGCALMCDSWYSDSVVVCKKTQATRQPPFPCKGTSRAQVAFSTELTRTGFPSDGLIDASFPGATAVRMFSASDASHKFYSPVKHLFLETTMLVKGYFLNQPEIDVAVL